MSDLERKLHEDKAMRDAARQMLETDLAVVRSNVPDRGLAKTATDEVSNVSSLIADRALGYAKAHPIVVTGGLLAMLLLLFRHAILDLFIGMLEDKGDSDQDSDHSPASGETGTRAQGGPDAEHDPSPVRSAGERSLSE